MNTPMYRLSIATLCTAAGLVFALGAARGGDLWKVGNEPSETSKADKDYQHWLGVADNLAIEIGKFKSEPPAPQFDRQRLRQRYRENIARAVEAYEKASHARPDAAEPHYRAAELIHTYVLERGINTPVMRDRDWAMRALEHWQEFEALAPLDPRVNETFFRRALVNTKMADDEGYKRAIENYEQLLQRADLASIHPENASIWLGNLAETYMMVGRLDDAIATYQRALDFSDKALSGYGLAVALDRNEQGIRAREVMRNYAEFDKFASLTKGDVFFVPQGELEYYLALGHEAIGDLQRSEMHYKAFIASGAHPRYQARARENLQWVVELRKRGSKPGKVPRVPRGLGL